MTRICRVLNAVGPALTGAVVLFTGLLLNRYFGAEYTNTPARCAAVTGCGFSIVAACQITSATV